MLIVQNHCSRCRKELSDCMVTVERRMSEKEQIFILLCYNNLAVNSAFFDPRRKHWVMGFWSDALLSRQSDGYQDYKKASRISQPRVYYFVVLYLKTGCKYSR